MEIEGIVEDIIFRNENNGYTVARLKTEDGSIVIVGNTTLINVEELIAVKGEWVYHDNFGEQFSFSQIRTTVPSTLKGIENYLASGLLPGIGPKTAKDIVNKFGMDSLDIIQFYPEKLKVIAGIGEKKLEKISKAYEEHRDLSDIMVYLQQYDISVNNGIKIYKKYGKDTIRVINENPYRLSEDLYGIGFKTADNIAKKMGISRESKFRIEAGLKYVMMLSAGEGHCYLPKEELKDRSSEILEVEEALIEDGIRAMGIQKNFKIVGNNEEYIVYYMPFYIAENNIATKLVEMSRAKVKAMNVDIDREVKKIEKIENMEFGERQNKAIRESMENGVMVITGGPGTGKTTTINAIIKIYEEAKMKVVLAAPTGRAAKRMTETTQRESKTIHRLLEFAYMEEEMAFNKDEESPLEADVIIIDETSMIDLLLMNSLLKAIEVGTRLILVGDIDQLPSVGAGNILKDIIESKAINVVKLDQIFRQAQESMIVVNAHKINKGELPTLNEKDKDFYFIRKPNPNEVLRTIIELNKDRLPKFYNIDPIRDIQILTPMKKGEVGINSINKAIQEVLNPRDSNKKEKEIQGEIYREGDKVMQIKNNYKTPWKIIENGYEVDKGEGIFNGDFGYISKIDTENNSMEILFDDEKLVEYDFNQIDELKLAYAITVHKSQGSEFPLVIMPIQWGPPMLLTRNLIYTAITRAKNLVVLVGQEKYLKMMIENNRISNRYSSLDLKIREYLNLYR